MKSNRTIIEIMIFFEHLNPLTRKEDRSNPETRKLSFENNQWAEHKQCSQISWNCLPFRWLFQPKAVPESQSFQTSSVQHSLMSGSNPSHQYLSIFRRNKYIKFTFIPFILSHISRLNLWGVLFRLKIHSAEWTQERQKLQFSEHRSQDGHALPTQSFDLNVG